MSVDAVDTSREVGGGSRSVIARHYRPILAYGVLAVLLILYRSLSDQVFTLPVVTATFNQGLALAVTAVAQTIVILTAGIDLSVGSIVALSNSVAATQMQPGVLPTLAVVVVTLAVGAAAGAFNGLLIAYGRLPPIIVTLATSAIYSGCALYVLPSAGGSAPEWYTDLLTGNLLGVPTAVVVLILLVVLVWLPVKSRPIGQAIYAIGSSQSAARMSGVNVKRTKLIAYALSGMLAALAGLILTGQTGSGDPTQGAAYTLNSIAATVIGGTSFAGGVGGPIGSIAGAYVFAIIPSVLFAARVSPFMKEFLQGAILVLTIGTGAARVLRLKNHLNILR